ncbi:GNAT family N-acetyltransferase [Rarobacter faecitabidus]|uniref:Ribosomal protein S18 acetylase RimI-like enzyme n=1 Tax=Rarobacter faecitabidus TaxID=13243 RepID=A0A542ZUP2_RARFA|nr:GNAT family N-acetyltransferase [Rarobacter faecitabidus]TQL64078.1 ribosomal protein S18 acetylase RimI-like enzyme [Rarobacter faecitabidus]
MEGRFEEVDIRRAKPADAGDIARVQVDAWRETYAGVLPAPILADLDVVSRAEKWAQDIESTEIHTWVATARDLGIVGFASLGPSQDADVTRTTQELYAIYLVPDAWGKGIARGLMKTVFEEVPDGADLTLWVIADNARALQFYRRHGFLDDGVERHSNADGAGAVEVRYRRRG